MPFITNPVFTQIEKRHLEFMLQYDFPERSFFVEQLNQMKDADITRDVTPYYWIMEFRPNGINPGHGPMAPCVDIEVLQGRELLRRSLLYTKGTVLLSSWRSIMQTALP